MRRNQRQRTAHPQRGHIVLGLLAVATAATTAHAEPPPPAPDADRAAARLSKLEDRLTAAEQDRQALRDEVKGLKEQVASAQDTTSTHERILSAWGYFDLSFARAYADNSAALYKVAVPNRSTFYMSGVNLFLKSELTRTLSALIETRLTYSPSGYESQWPVDVYVGGAKATSFGTYQRVDTTSRSPLSQLVYHQNGLVIERAYADWKPADWFGLRLGRYLTPFGIWNEDHGSPVLIGVDNPQLMNFDLIPLAQTGVEVFGTRALGDELRLDYALTFSNGHGPADEYMSFTDNKAVGLRLKATYVTDDVHVRLGGYLYAGQYRDRVQGTFVKLTPNMQLDPNASPSFGSYETTTSQYEETAVTGEAELRFKRARLLGEVVHHTVVYDVPNQIADDDKLLKGVPYGETVYDASHYGWGGYVLGAYEIPIRLAGTDVLVTPYAGYDYLLPSSTIKVKANKQLRFGLNIKPSPYVTWKVETMRVMPEAKAVASSMTLVVTQLAVAF